MVESLEEVGTAVPELRADVRRWLAEHRHLGPGRAFREAVIDAGWAAPSWPSAWFGRGLPMSLSRIVSEELVRVAAPGSGQDASNLWANTVLAFGSDDMKRRFLRPLLLGEISMCLLYSEPGAGSDLAAVRTRAERDGDEWVVNGQKVWTSGAREADYGMLIARTDWGVPKHRGISFFFLPMKQPGIEVRPVRQATGDARFNEVFITGARVPDANRVGAVGDGWRVLQTALMYERFVLGRSSGSGQSRAVRPEREDTGSHPPDVSLISLARSRGAQADPRTRQGLARLDSLRTVNAWNGTRARAKLQQGSSSPAASLGKLASPPHGRPPGGVDPGHGGHPGRARPPAGGGPQLLPAERLLHLHRRPDRPGPAQHHRRTDPRASQRAGGRQGRPVQGRGLVPVRHPVAGPSAGP